MADVAIPAGIRRSRLYQNLVDVTLRFLIEEVGGAEGVHRAGDALPENFLARRRHRARRRSPSASSRFAPRPSGSSPRPTSAAWDGS